MALDLRELTSPDAPERRPPAVDCRHVSKFFYTRSAATTPPLRARPDTRAGVDGPRGGRRGWRPHGWPFFRMPVAHRVEALVDITFCVQPGEIFGIIGPNGSGKSTLVRLLSTLLLPDQGEVRIFGYDAVRDQLAVRRFINRVSSDAAFFKKLSALENLVYAARLYDLPVREATQQAMEILRRLGLPRAKLDVPLEELSRGMQQKVAIARALFTSPVLLLLDEPTTGLDPRSKREVQAFIASVHAEHQATVLLTTHDMQEAERLCSRVGFLKDGRLAAVGRVEELKASVPGGARSLEELFFAMTGSEWESEEVPADA